MPTETIKASPDAGKIPTPVFPTEPPAEVKEMKFDLDPSFLQQGSDSIISVDHKEVKTETAPIKEETKTEEPKTVLTPPSKEEPPKVEEPPKKEEPKKEDSKVSSVLKAPTETKKEEQKEAVVSAGDKTPSKLITPVRDSSKDKDTFDYAPYSAQEVDILKNMARHSREFTANLIKQNKELSTLKDSNYLQHEQGYTLSPEYRELQLRNYRARVEAQCWQKSLLDIKAGNKFKEITGFDPQTGEPIMSGDLDPSDVHEIRISNNLSACVNAINQNQAQLQTYPNQFRNRITGDLVAINQERQARFAWVQDPKLLEYSVNVDGQGEKKIKDIRAEFKSIWPNYLANSPGVEVASDLFVAMIIQGAELREARNGKQIADIKTEEARRAEPSSDAVDSKINGSPSKNGVPTTFSLAGSPLEQS